MWDLKVNLKSKFKQQRIHYHYQRFQIRAIALMSLLKINFKNKRINQVNTMNNGKMNKRFIITRTVISNKTLNSWDKFIKPRSSFKKNKK